MKIRVKLLGTLGQRFPGYSAEQGLALEVSAGARVGDLLTHLGISTTKGLTAVKEGHIMSAEETLTEGALLQVFQAMYGG